MEEDSEGFPTEMIREGNVRVIVPELDAYRKAPSDYAPSKAPVFYNPVMELNRDIAVLALQAYQKVIGHEITVCEPLSSCGVRGVRFAAEVSGVKTVTMNDISMKACRLAVRNVKANHLEQKVTVEHEDANLLLSRHGAPHLRFDAVDVDPFGSPVHYIDSAVRALRDGGLLALTATDMAPLCGVHPRACLRKYGGKPLRTEYCHELAVRLLTGCVAFVAAKHDIGMRIMFSHSAEHYIRMYAVMEYGAKNADESLKNMGYVMHCFNCFHRESSAGTSVGYSGKCVECGSKLSVGGPMWLGKLCDADFCRMMSDELKGRAFKLGDRIHKTLELATSETEVSIGYYVVDRLCDALNLPVPSTKSILNAIKKEGFRASLTRFNPKGIRSDIPASKMRCIFLETAGADSDRRDKS